MVGPVRIGILCAAAALALASGSPHNAAAQGSAHAHSDLAVHAHSPRPPEKPNGQTREFKRFAFLANEGDSMTFQEATTVRYEPRSSGRHSFAERRFAAGERANCEAAAFNAAGSVIGWHEYVCTRLVDTITVRELMPQATGRPYVDRRLEMAPRRGYERPLLGASLGPHQHRPGPGGEFRIQCAISHMGFEDPIVSPGREFWHHHTFAGNPNMNRHTANPLDYPDALCSGGNVNRSAYWFPSVIDTRFGAPVLPDGVVVYYKGAPDTVPPPGLRFITGDPMRTNPRDSKVFPVSIWACLPPSGPGITQGLQDEIPVACPVGWRIVWSVYFPRCWDGVGLDSADHKSHMFDAGGRDGPIANRQPNGCPATHPRRLFDLSINVGFTVRADDDVSRWRLSTDSYEWSKPAGYSAHADWWNGWDQDFLAAIKAECHDKSRNCGADNAPDGRRMLWK